VVIGLWYSVRRGNEFYGFLENLFTTKLKPGLTDTLKQRLASSFEYELTDADYSKMTDVIINKHARSEVSKIIHYMTGTAAGRSVRIGGEHHSNQLSAPFIDPPRTSRRSASG
jgi:hypothetical protein